MFVVTWREWERKKKAFVDKLLFFVILSLWRFCYFPFWILVLSANPCTQYILSKHVSKWLHQEPWAVTLKFDLSPRVLLLLPILEKSFQKLEKGGTDSLVFKDACSFCKLDSWSRILLKIKKKGTELSVQCLIDLQGDAKLLCGVYFCSIVKIRSMQIYKFDNSYMK